MSMLADWRTGEKKMMIFCFQQKLGCLSLCHGSSFQRIVRDNANSLGARSEGAVVVTPTTEPRQRCRGRQRVTGWELEHISTSSLLISARLAYNRA
jgi:hypothetical protein